MSLSGLLVGKTGAVNSHCIESFRIWRARPPVRGTSAAKKQPEDTPIIDVLKKVQASKCNKEFNDDDRLLRTFNLPGFGHIELRAKKMDDEEKT